MANCESILRALPEYFSIESVLLDYLQDIETMPSFVAWLDERVIGFITINRHEREIAEIQVMAVDRGQRRKGTGHMLIEAAVKHLKQEGVTSLEVKTLGETHLDKNYVKTRAFYAAQGFQSVEEILDYWPGNLPMLLMAKVL